MPDIRRGRICNSPVKKNLLLFYRLSQYYPFVLKKTGIAAGKMKLPDKRCNAYSINQESLTNGKVLNYDNRTQKRRIDKKSFKQNGDSLFPAQLSYTFHHNIQVICDFVITCINQIEACDHFTIGIFFPESVGRV